MEWLWEPQRRRTSSEHRVALDLVRGVGHEITIEAVDLPGVIVAMDYEPREHRGPDLMKVELEGGDDPEVPIPAADAPEEFRVPIFTRVHQLAVRRHDIHRAEVVVGQSARPGAR